MATETKKQALTHLFESIEKDLKSLEKELETTPGSILKDPRLPNIAGRSATRLYLEWKEKNQNESSYVADLPSMSHLLSIVPDGGKPRVSTLEPGLQEPLFLAFDVTTRDHFTSTLYDVAHWINSTTIRLRKGHALLTEEYDMLTAIWEASNHDFLFCDELRTEFLQATPNPNPNPNPNPHANPNTNPNPNANPKP